jgi:uncharacterized cofD-like protein
MFETGSNMNMKAQAKAEPGKTKVPAPPTSRSGRSPIEQLAEAVLKYSAGDVRAVHADRSVVQEVLSFDLRGTRAVILGGGTGLSTVVGGNANMADWADRPYVGLKQEFPHLDVVVCTTDDGGSTGQLLKQLPMIAIGDLRKSFVSLVRQDALQRRYRLGNEQARDLVRLIQRVFTYRFDSARADRRFLRDPLLAAPPPLRSVCPRALATALRSLGGYLSPGGRGPTIDPAGHSLGNLILTASIFRAAGGRIDRPPRLQEIRRGMNGLGGLIGVAGARLHPATATPGQLKFRYANGVEVYGQSKSAAARRGCPVEWLAAEFTEEPIVSTAVCRTIRNADLIVYAPGSLYTSIIPILQLRPIVDAIRANRKALKILGANFWIQEGETDISLRHEGRGFLVSDLIEAYARNVPGGAASLFDIILSANLEQLPGNILRNYALEGKSPIHLDRARVEKMGFQPFEATLFSPDFRMPARVIHHDPERFALVIRTLLYGRHAARETRYRLEKRSPVPRLSGSKPGTPAGLQRRPGLCDYLDSIRAALEQRRYTPARLKSVLLDLAWENRDVRPAHLGYFAGARVIPAKKWNRSTEWDNVLGYFDPEDRFLKIHEQLLSQPTRLREDLLIALGESLLGRYIESRRWIEHSAAGQAGARCYQTRLRPHQQRESYLTDAQLRKYLGLARMIQDSSDPLVYQITINDNERFLPPGLLFGLLYAWYLNNRYAATMEYEMSILRWSPRSLIPHQAAERIRKQALVKFFRTDIFGHPCA